VDDTTKELKKLVGRDLVPAAQYPMMGRTSLDCVVKLLPDVPGGKPGDDVVTRLIAGQIQQSSELARANEDREHVVGPHAHSKRDAYYLWAARGLGTHNVSLAEGLEGAKAAKVLMDWQNDHSFEVGRSGLLTSLTPKIINGFTKLDFGFQMGKKSDVSNWSITVADCVPVPAELVRAHRIVNMKGTPSKNPPIMTWPTWKEHLKVFIQLFCGFFGWEFEPSLKGLRSYIKRWHETLGSRWTYGRTPRTSGLAR
jgi:hypothetical protein